MNVYDTVSINYIHISNYHPYSEEVFDIGLYDYTIRKHNYIYNYDPMFYVLINEKIFNYLKYKL